MLFTVQLTEGFKPQLFLEFSEVKRNDMCGNDYSTMIYNPLHSQWPHSSLSNYSLSVEAAVKLQHRPTQEVLCFVVVIHFAQHRKPSEKPVVAFFNQKDGLHLCSLLGTPSLTLHAALASHGRDARRAPHLL